MSEAAVFPSSTRAEPFLRGVVGAVVLLLLIRAAEPLFFGEGFYASLSIHPYWIVVVLAAMQNGCLAGVATAAAATLLMDWPPRPTGIDITEHYVELAVLPVQWMLTALVIGTFREGQLRHDHVLTLENIRLRQLSEDLATEIDRLDGEIAALELEAATRAVSASVRDSTRSEELASDTPHACAFGTKPATPDVDRTRRSQHPVPGDISTTARTGSKTETAGVGKKSAHDEKGL